MRKLLRYWPVFVIAAAACGVGAAYLAAAWYTQEPPNYSRVEEGLFMGGSVRRPPPGVTAVLNLCETADPYHVEVERWRPIPDAEPAPSLDWLGEQVGFVESQRRAGRVVFVHCLNGVSRSGLVVVAYLMAHEGWPRDEALRYVRSARPDVRPNPAFMRLLLEWEDSVRAGGAKAARVAAADRRGI
jgi:atypical dual specificity phosphatase